MIPHIEPYYGQKAARAVYDLVIDGSWLTEYKKTRELEEKIESFLGVKWCFMYPNCTLALYAASVAIGIDGNDMVVVPDMTMIASANAVRMAGAGILLKDVNQDSLCIDLSLPPRKDIKAIVAVDLNGRAPDYTRLKEYAWKHRLYIIEDAAQALGSCHDGKPLGTFGDIGCFSFSPHKIISTGQGGCCVTNNAKLAQRLKEFRNFGRVKSSGFDHAYFGINLKFTDLQAVVGLTQFENLEWRIERKKEIYQRYLDRLYGFVEFLPTDLENVTPWYMDIYTPLRDGLAAYLKKRDIGTQKMYPALHTTEPYYRWGQIFNVSSWAAEKGLFLPSSITLTDGQIDMVCDKIIEFFSRFRKEY